MIRTKPASSCEFDTHMLAPYLRWTPYPVIVTIRVNKDYIRVLLYSYYTTITGWGVLLNDTNQQLGPRASDEHVTSMASHYLETLNPKPKVDILASLEEDNITEDVIRVEKLRVLRGT